MTNSMAVLFSDQLPTRETDRVYWPQTEKWLQQRYSEIHPGCEQKENFSILGYEWRALRFNAETRQSAVKLMAACRESDPGSVYFMQQAHCLAVPSMAFPSFSVMTPSGERAHSKPDPLEEVTWKGIHERLLLYESDGEKFIIDSTKLYDMVFVDAHDGEDIFPHKLWDLHSPFLKALANRLHPKHGNLHADTDLLNDDGSVPHELLLPMGKYVKRVCRAYKDVLVGNGSDGLAFNVLVPWVCNSSLVVSRGFRMSRGLLHRDVVLNTLVSNSLEVESILNLPFSCFEYIKRGLNLVS